MYSVIKKKIGECVECNSGKETYLVSGRCQYHYKLYLFNKNKERDKERAIKSGIDYTDESFKLRAWYAHFMKYSPKVCENCLKSLDTYSESDWFGCHHHILEKSLFPSVKLNMLNHIVLCKWECHAIVTADPSKIVDMAIFKKAKEIVRIIKPNVVFSEIRRIPDYFNE